ncbi:V-type proton ATPase subunit a1 [Vitis vinifera]|uniref:V-type proton ATPase subunit a1 n=1 Tax=Vitis vinifera TaxID=29760 RepID=A0A438JC91_VITVI|nr:V-type proton ATPase subunit a1 [Vitis vinifera]
MIFLNRLFGYLLLLIIIKWCTGSQSDLYHLIQLLVSYCSSMDALSKTFYFEAASFGGVMSLKLHCIDGYLMIVVHIYVSLYLDINGFQGRTYGILDTSEMDLEVEPDSAQHHEEFNFSEICVHQMIHSIEFILASSTRNCQPSSMRKSLHGGSKVLDRFLVSEDWESRFSGVVQSTLSIPVSDHYPILLDVGGVRSGPLPFRFENMWLKEEGFKDLLKDWWQGLNFRGSSSFILAAKLKALKERSRALSMEEGEARKEAKEEFKKWVLMEEISWRQKSREVWLKEGDRNTSFFHRMANSHRRSNLTKIKINGYWIVEKREIQGAVVSAFQHLLSDLGGWSPSLDGLVFDRLEGEEAVRLEEPFSVKEVVSALFDLSGDKAPGQMHGRFVRSLNSTFLVLVPKKGDAEDLRDYMPVSLVGGLYKLLAKVLANRLKQVMGKVVSSSQNTFVEGRQILDAVLIANEAVDFLLKSVEENGVWRKMGKLLNGKLTLMLLEFPSCIGDLLMADVVGTAIPMYNNIVIRMVGLSSFCLCYCFHTAHDGDTWCFPPCLASPLGGIPKCYHGGYKFRPFSFASLTDDKD